MLLCASEPGINNIAGGMPRRRREPLAAAVGGVRGSGGGVRRRRRGPRSSRCSPPPGAPPPPRRAGSRHPQGRPPDPPPAPDAGGIGIQRGGRKSPTCSFSGLTLLFCDLSKYRPNRRDMAPPGARGIGSLRGAGGRVYWSGSEVSSDCNGAPDGAARKHEERWPRDTAHQRGCESGRVRAGFRRR